MLYEDHEVTQSTQIYVIVTRPDLAFSGTLKHTSVVSVCVYVCGVGVCVFV